MRKLVTLMLAVVLVGVSAAVVFAAGKPGTNSGSPVGTTDTQTTDTTTTPKHDGAVDRHRKRGHHKRGHHKRHLGRQAGNRVRHGNRAAGAAEVPDQPDDTPGQVPDDRGRGADDGAQHNDGQHHEGDHQNGDHQDDNQVDAEHGNEGPASGKDDVGEGDHGGGGDNSEHNGGAND